MRIETFFYHKSELGHLILSLRGFVDRKELTLSREFRDEVSWRCQLSLPTKL
jgi:hypothetical protein